MRNPLIFLIALSTLLAACKEKNKNSDKRTLFNEEFKWTITIPPGFEAVSAKKWSEIEKRGEAALEKTYGEDVENNSKRIFVFSSDQLNYFEASYEPFDHSIDGNFLENLHLTTALAYHTFETQMEGARLDSSYSMTTVSGMTFHTFRITIALPNKMTMNMLLFSRLIDGKALSVNIMTVDKRKEKELLAAWTSSKFERPQAE